MTASPAPFQRCNWPRGKVMGGSSVLNYMVYVRGNRLDYEQWHNNGNYGWDFETVLHYFKKSEDNRNPYIAQNSNEPIWSPFFTPTRWIG